MTSEQLKRGEEIQGLLRKKTDYLERLKRRGIETIYDGTQHISFEELNQSLRTTIDVLIQNSLEQDIKQLEEEFQNL